MHCLWYTGAKKGAVYVKRFFVCADEFVRQSSWRDLALVKLCLCAAGLMIGMALPKRAKKTASMVAAGVFCCTYLPLILKFLRIFHEDKEKQAL